MPKNKAYWTGPSSGFEKWYGHSKRHRRSARAEGTSGGEHERGVIPPLVKEVRGSPPRKFLNLTCV